MTQDEARSLADAGYMPMASYVALCEKQGWSTEDTMATKSSKEAATPRTPRTAEAQTPRPAPRFDEGFAGAPPEQEGWFATNHLLFKDGILHQLHKGQGEDGLTRWWWFPVSSAD